MSVSSDSCYGELCTARTIASSRDGQNTSQKANYGHWHPATIHAMLISERSADFARMLLYQYTVPTKPPTTWRLPAPMSRETSTHDVDEDAVSHLKECSCRVFDRRPEPLACPAVSLKACYLISIKEKKEDQSAASGN
ncbi:hypothetical protein E4U27_005753 [Claviceps purpurea]|nr:hypothetical protein E4U27_005753 [Claviceps purpurea]